MQPKVGDLFHIDGVPEYYAYAFVTRVENRIVDYYYLCDPTDNRKVYLSEFFKNYIKIVNR